MRKTTDTNSDYGSEIPDGTYDFEIVKIAEGPKGSDRWVLEYNGDQEGEQLLWPNNEGPLLRLLGCTETSKGIFEWETEMMEGKKFTATVTHEADKKTGKIYQKMSDFKAAKEDDAPPF